MPIELEPKHWQRGRGGGESAVPRCLTPHAWFAFHRWERNTRRFFLCPLPRIAFMWVASSLSWSAWTRPSTCSSHGFQPIWF